MSMEVPIPGGTARIRSRDEMTVRQRRLVESTFMMTGHIYTQLPEDMLEKARESGANGEATPEALDAQKKVARMVASLHLSRADAETLLSMQDAAIVAFLESWTLDQELPTMDNVQDLSPELYDALALATAPQAAKLSTSTLNLDPTPGDQDSPTGGSATSSNNSSTAIAEPTSA